MLSSTSQLYSLLVSVNNESDRVIKNKYSHLSVLCKCNMQTKGMIIFKVYIIFCMKMYLNYRKYTEIVFQLQNKILV